MKTQRGVSLVEIMVAITIGLLLMLGLGTVFVTVSQTSKLRQNMSGVQDNERTAIAFLNNSIRSAGFNPSPANVNQFTASGSFTTTGQTIYGSGSGAGADTVSVRFIAPPAGTTTSQGCSATLTAGDVYEDDFTVAGGYLTCTEKDVTAGGAAAPAVNLVPNVAGMNIVYGIDPASPNCSGSATEYQPGNSVPASVWGGTCGGAPGGQLKTVNITLQFNNPLAGQTSQPTTVTINQTIPYMIGL